MAVNVLSKVSWKKSVAYKQVCIYFWKRQKQLPRGVVRKRYSENMQQIYREHPCRSVILIKVLWNHSMVWVFSFKFAAPFPKNTSWGLLLNETEYISFRSRVCWIIRNLMVTDRSSRSEVFCKNGFWKISQNSQEKAWDLQLF